MHIITKHISEILLSKSSHLFLIMESTSARQLRSQKSIKVDTLKAELKSKPQKVNKKKETKKNLPPQSKVSGIKIKSETLEIASQHFELPTKLSDSDDFTTSKSSALEKSIPTPKKKRQSKNSKDSSVKPEKISKIKKESEDIFDIEDGGWKPDNWSAVLDNILKMRKLYIAPVDSLGCEECPEDNIPPEVSRYQTLISVMLSSQTRDEVTFAAVQRLVVHGLTVNNILNTPDERIGELIYPAGFWKTKIKYIKNTTQILKDKYNGDIPRTYEELIKLPGVGPKMAHLAMSCAWHETVGICVDTHVHRISNRLGWVPKPTKTPEQTRKALEMWLPKDQWKPINLILVGFGQTICKPIGPSCDICLNKDICPFGRNVLSSKPKKKAKN